MYKLDKYYWIERIVSECSTNGWLVFNVDDLLSYEILLKRVIYYYYFGIDMINKCVIFIYIYILYIYIFVLISKPSLKPT